MQLNVLAELKQPIGSEVTLDIAEEAIVLGDIELRDVHGTVILLRTDRGLMVTVKAAGLIQETCSRCLADTDCAIPIELQEEFVPMVGPVTGAHPQVEEAEAFRIASNGALDLGEGLRQYVLISEPPKPLCRQDCRGLCAGCGVDLNNVACQCISQSITQTDGLPAVSSIRIQGS